MKKVKYFFKYDLPNSIEKFTDRLDEWHNFKKFLGVAISFGSLLRLVFFGASIYLVYLNKDFLCRFYAPGSFDNDEEIIYGMFFVGGSYLIGLFLYLVIPPHPITLDRYTRNGSKSFHHVPALFSIGVIIMGWCIGIIISQCLTEEFYDIVLYRIIIQNAYLLLSKATFWAFPANEQVFSSYYDRIGPHIVDSKRSWRPCWWK